MGFKVSSNPNHSMVLWASLCHVLLTTTAISPVEAANIQVVSAYCHIVYFLKSFFFFPLESIEDKYLEFLEIWLGSTCFYVKDKVWYCCWFGRGCTDEICLKSLGSHLKQAISVCQLKQIFCSVASQLNLIYLQNFVLLILTERGGKVIKY